MYYDHDGRTIAAGMEVIARMDQTGADVLRAYAGCVEVTVALPGDSTRWKRTGVGTLEAISFQMAGKLPLRGF